MLYFKKSMNHIIYIMEIAYHSRCHSWRRRRRRPVYRARNGSPSECPGRSSAGGGNAIIRHKQVQAANKKIAICLTGELRTFEYCKYNIISIIILLKKFFYVKIFFIMEPEIVLLKSIKYELQH